MPTDESYLDSLLNGLSSETEHDDDRFSAYRKSTRRNSENTVTISKEPEEREPVVIPQKEEKDDVVFHTLPEDEELPSQGDFFFSDDWMNPKEPEETPEIRFGEDDEEHQEDRFDFSDEDDLGISDMLDLTGADSDDAGFDDNLRSDDYNIFGDYDDADIDRMIDEELSAEMNDGELFGMSETPSAYIPKEPTEEPSMYEEPAAEPEEQPGEETQEETQEETTDPLAELFGNPETEEQEPAQEEDPLAGLMDETSESESETEGSKTDIDDFMPDFNFGGEEPQNAEEEPAGEESPDLFGESEGSNGILGGSEGLSEDDLDSLFNAGENNTEESSSDDPLSGLVFDLGESSPESDEASEPAGSSDSSSDGGLGDLLGSMDNLEEGDVRSLNNLFNDIQVTEEDTLEKKKKTKKKKNKKPWYLAVFGNVPIPEDKIKPEPTEEEIAAKKAALAEARKAVAAEKKAQKEEAKKAKAAEKAEKAKMTAEQKAAAKEKKREEISKLILEDTDNTTRLNKAGVTIIFAMFVGIAALIISGSSNIAYRTTVKSAKKDYEDAYIYRDLSLYTSAYDKIYGLELDEKDYELGEKIYTVNFVNTQISSFNSHYATGDYTSGLNDLFKGLLRYNKWIPYAVGLGNQDDLYFVRDQILGLLEGVYNISEEEAMTVLSTYVGITDTENEASANLYYTKYIYNTVTELGLENQTNNE